MSIMDEVKTLALELEDVGNMIADDQFEELKAKYGTEGVKLMARKIYRLAVQQEDAIKATTATPDQHPGRNAFVKFS
jgi:hypothetical protein